MRICYGYGQSHWSSTGSIVRMTLDVKLGNSVFVFALGNLAIPPFVVLS